MTKVCNLVKVEKIASKWYGLRMAVLENGQPIEFGYDDTVETAMPRELFWNYQRYFVGVGL